MQKIVFGLVGPRCAHRARKEWNALFSSRSLDAFFDFYRTSSRRDLELRLAEMFLHKRRGYLMDSPLQKTVMVSLDRLALSARRKKKVDVIVNEGGVLIGHYVGSRGGEWPKEEVLSLWFPEG